MDGNYIRLEENMPESIRLPEEEIVADAIEWTGGKGKYNTEGEGKNDKENQARKKGRRRFVHALILRQRPRLMATAWSDAAAVENEQREIAELKQQWLTQLERLGLLRRKAGGFIWLHLQCRQLIRKILERTEKVPEGTGYAAARRVLQSWNAQAQEAAIHSELAGWYEKVLDASESPPAAFEALYHLCEAARKFAGQNEMSRARVKLAAARALLNLTSLLIQTQGYARGSCRRLGHIRELGRILESRPELKDEPRLLRIACTEVMRAIAREVGEDAKAFLRHRQVGELHFLAPGGRLKETMADAVHPPRNLSIKVAGALLSSAKAGIGKDSRVIEDLSKVMRWYRWSGMLAMASRSYVRAEKAFLRAEKVFQQAEKQKLPGTFANKRPVSQRLQVEQLRIIEQRVELMLLKYSLQERWTDVSGAKLVSQAPAGSGKRKASIEQLNEIRGRIKKGRDVAANIRGRDHSFDSHHTINANGCECRLFIHESIRESLKSRLVPPRRGARVLNRAMGRLGDAEASLRVSDPRRYRSELAMLELHRADVRLHAAELVPIKWEATIMGFAPSRPALKG